MWVLYGDSYVRCKRVEIVPDVAFEGRVNRYSHAERRGEVDKEGYAQLRRRREAVWTRS